MDDVMKLVSLASPSFKSYLIFYVNFNFFMLKLYWLRPKKRPTLQLKLTWGPGQLSCLFSGPQRRSRT